MRIVLSSAWFPVCVAVYLLRAARRAGHDVVTVGPTSGRTIPWEDGYEAPEEYAVRPDLWPGDPTEDSAARAADAARACDVWIDVDGGWFLAADLPTRRRIGLFTDPHVWNYDERRPYVDACVTMQPAYRRRESDAVVLYGYDPEWHRAMPDVVEDFDVTILGAPYPERIEIAARLRAAGFRVLGPGRGHFGPEYARQLCRAPLALVWPLAKDIPARLFEALACGRAVIMRNVPGMDDLWRTEHVAGDPENVERIVHLGPGVITAPDLEAFVRRAIEYGPGGPTKNAALITEARRCSEGGERSLCPYETWDARLAALLEV